MPPISRAQWVAYYAHGVPIPQLQPTPQQLAQQAAQQAANQQQAATAQAQQAQQDALVAHGISALKQGGY